MTEADISSSSDEGLAICLSGGGFRATLFHLGALRRLNELGVLSRATVITSVSGGSILNGVLATRWTRLTPQTTGVFRNFDELVGKPVRRFCSQDLRTPLLFGFRADPVNWPTLLRTGFAIPANQLAEAYRSLYEDQALRHLPPPTPGMAPRFVFCATSVQTGACWHFHSGPDGRMGDFYTDYTETTGISVAQAVAASSAFPPGFAALKLPLSELAVKAFSRLDPWGIVRPESKKRPVLPIGDRRTIWLTDGGVYDNLGVEPVWDRIGTLLISDAGHPLGSEAKCQQWILPRLSRAFEISSEQVGAVRKRWFMDGKANPGPKNRAGTLWSINTLLEDFHNPTAQGYLPACIERLVGIRTDLNAFSPGEIACLENHGYSLADAAVRTYAPGKCLVPGAPFTWPHPDWSTPKQLAEALRDSGKRRLVKDILSYCLRSMGIRT